MAGVIAQRYKRVKVDQVQMHPENPRRGNVEAIAESIDADGFYGALVVQASTGYILAGNHRWQAAKRQGLAELPAIVVDVDDDLARRILLVDNRTADLATWDNAQLVALLEELAVTDATLAGTGFTMDDLAALALPPALEEDPPTPEPPAVARTKRGDVYLLGDHRVMCGDCRDAGDVNRLLEPLDRWGVNLAFTSPPYADRRTYDETSEFRPVPPADYVEWFEPCAANVAAHLAADGSWFVNIKPGVDGLDTDLYVHDLVAAHVRQWGWHFATELCWERNGVPKQAVLRLKNQFEPVYQFARGRWKLRPDHVAVPTSNAIISLGPGSGNTGWADRQGHGGVIDPARKARRRSHGTTEQMSSVQGRNAAPGEFTGEGMAYPGNRLPAFAHDHQATGHTAAFPVGLPEWFIRAYTDAGDVVYDPFGGSGSTLLAAERTRRASYSMEISPRYVDVICRRWQDHTGVVPTLAATGKAVDFTAPPPRGGRKSGTPR